MSTEQCSDARRSGQRAMWCSEVWEHGRAWAKRKLLISEQITSGADSWLHNMPTGKETI